MHFGSIRFPLVMVVASWAAHPRYVVLVVLATGVCLLLVVVVVVVVVMVSCDWLVHVQLESDWL